MLKGKYFRILKGKYFRIPADGGVRPGQAQRVAAAILILLLSGVLSHLLIKYFHENMKYFYENNEIFSFLTSRLLFSVSRSRLLFIVMERAMMMMMMMMMMMKEVELVVEMRSASCRTDLQGLQLLLSAVPASAALTFLSAHS